jgi:zinc transport system substrate-binding protein
VKNFTLQLLFICCLFSAVAGSQALAASQNQKIGYVVTIQPLAAILEKVVEGRGEVIRLLAPGSSPHTFEPRPSDAVLLERARALFFAGPGLDKEWTAKIPAANRVEMLQLVPREHHLTMDDHNHDHADHEQEKKQTRRRNKEEKAVDPHFWTDPLTVKAMLPALVEELSKLDPEGGGIYQQNAGRFATELDQLHIRAAAILEPVKGRAVLLFHPSFLYLLNRYDLEFAGTIEPFPGREPSPRALHELIKKVRNHDIKAVFTEPQLSPRPAQVVAESAGLKLYELDPNGGIEGRRTYEELILYNARTLATALR